MSVETRLESYEFRREREASWRELEGLLARADRHGLGRLEADDLYRLPVLHRAALSSLSVARAISLDRNVVEYLEGLCARAHVHVYGAKRTYGSTLRQFFTDTFPARVWAMRRAVLLSAALLALGLLCGYLLTVRDPDLFYSFVPEGLAQGRDPTSTPAELREVLYSGADDEPLSLLASFLFIHNAQIGLLCFAVGIAAGVPVALLLLHNGVLLGAFAALYARAGLALPFWLWVLPHGVTELLAVVLCGAAGLRLGASLVFPGRHRRVDSVALEGRHAAVIVIGCISLFLLAGGIEGYFRQLVPDDGVRAMVTLATALLWVLYFGVHGRQCARATSAEEGRTEVPREGPIPSAQPRPTSEEASPGDVRAGSTGEARESA